MATSAITFEGSLDLNAANTFGSLDFQFKPPAHLCSQLCYAEVKIFQLSWGTLYGSSASHHCFILRQRGWTQPQSARVQPANQSMVGNAIAVMNLGSPGTGVPFLFFMPDGPHTITLTVDRLDLGIISSGAGDPDMIVVMDIVPAASRQIPLN